MFSLIGRKDLSEEVIRQINNAPKRADAVQVLYDYLGKAKSKTEGPANIAGVVADIRGINPASVFGYAKKLIEDGFIPESKLVSETGCQPTFEQTDISLTIDDKTGDIGQQVLGSSSTQPVGPVTTPTGTIIPNADLSALIPQGKIIYFPRKIGRIKDTKLLMDKFQVCRCSNPKFSHPQSPDNKPIKGLEFCTHCKLPKFRRPILLEGEQSTGKNQLVKYIAKKLNLPIIRVEFDATTEFARIVGEYKPGLDGKFVFVDGLLTIAIKYGAVFVGDELNMARSDLTSFLHELLEPGGRLCVPELNLYITPHPNFWFIATMNPNYKGTKPLNEALRARFDVVKLRYQSRVDTRLTGDKRLVEIATNIRQLYERGELTLTVGSRDLIAFAENRIRFGANLAIEVLCNKFPDEEAVQIREALSTLLGDDTSDEEDDKDDDDDAEEA